MASASSVSTPSKMKAFVYSEYGNPADVLKLQTDIALPEVEEDQVLVKVIAAGLNPIDFKRMLGLFKSPLPIIAGRDVAGVVVKVGISLVSASIHGGLCIASKINRSKST